MKRKILSLILAVCMLLSCLPFAAMAQEEGEAVPGEQTLPEERDVSPSGKEEPPAPEKEICAEPSASGQETAPQDPPAPEEEETQAASVPEEAAGPAAESSFEKEEELTEEAAPAEEPVREPECSAEEPLPEEQASEDGQPSADVPAEKEPQPEEGPAEEPTEAEGPQTGKEPAAEEGPAEEQTNAEELPPEEEASEAEAPETEAPETEASETEAPEAEASEEEPLSPEDLQLQEEWSKELLAYTILTPSNFPDAAFRYAIYSVHGPLTAYEAAQITSLDVSGQYISDLTGIRFFTHLVTLDCSDNYISSLSLPALRYLDTLDCSNNGLKYLSVRSCSYLRELDVSDNPLETVDVSGLYWLETLNANNDPIRTLRMRGCESLDTIYAPTADLVTVQAEECCSLTVIDLSAATDLVSLDVRDCTGLISLTVNSGKLNSLRVSGCASLTSLDCSNTSLSSLDLTDCLSLSTLDCSFSLLTALTVRSCPKLAGLDCRGNFLKKLSLPYATGLVTLYCDVNELTSLDLTGCMALKELSCTDNYLSSLTLTDCFSLEELACNDNRLTELDLSTLAQLKTLNCSGNEITELDITPCTALTSLNCGRNRLLHLDKTAVAALSAVSLGTQHPEVKLRAYLPYEDHSVAFADLRQLITEEEKSLISVTLPCLDAKAYLPVLTPDVKTLSYTVDYGTVQMEVTVPVSYVKTSPFSSEQEYFLLDSSETLSPLSDLIEFGAFSGVSALGITYEAWNAKETVPSTVITVSSDSVTAASNGSAVLYAKPYLTYNTADYYFAPIRFRIDVAKNAGAAVDEVTGVSVPESSLKVKLFSTSYTRIELLLERKALKNMTSSGRLVDNADIEPVGEYVHNIIYASFTDTDAADIFDLKILDDRTLAVVPKYIALQAAWYSSRFVKSSYRSTIRVTLDNGKSFLTNKVTLSVKQTKPSVSASSVSIDTLDIFSSGARTAFPIKFKSSSRVIAAEPNPDYKQPLPSWLSLDGEGLEFIYAGDEAKKASGHAYLLVTLEGWAIKVPVKVRVKAVCSLTMRFEKKHLHLRADAADSDLVAFTTKPLSERGIDFFRDNAALTEATERGKSYDPGDLFTMTEYYNASKGYYGWYLQVKPGSPADNGRSHSYTVSLTVAEKTVYFYVKVIPFTTKPVLSLRSGKTVDITVPGSYTDCKIALKNMNLDAQDGAGHYLVEPIFHVTLGSPYGTDISGLFDISLNRKTGKVRVRLDGYMPLSKQYYAFLWAEVDNGGFAHATDYARFTLKESAASKVKPSFKLRRSGTVDTSRAGSYIKLSPSVKNFPLYDLDDCTFTFYKKVDGRWKEMNNGDLYFNVKNNKAKDRFEISAADPINYPLKPGNGYAYVASWQFDSKTCTYGSEKYPIVLPVRQNKVTFTSSPDEGTISRLDGYADLLLHLTAKDSDVNAIDRIKLDSSSAKYFVITETETKGVFRLGWTNTSSRLDLRAGTRRTVTLNIFLEGNCTTKPNATVKIRVKLA